MTADVVFAPRPDDAHQDHRLIAELAPTVWRDALVLHYEIPSGTATSGRVSHYVALEPEIAAARWNSSMSASRRRRVATGGMTRPSCH